MKKLTLLFTIAAAIFISSCSTEKNVAFTKRRYMNGRYVEKSADVARVENKAEYKQIVPTKENSFVNVEKNTVSAQLVDKKAEAVKVSLSAKLNTIRTINKAYAAVSKNADAKSTFGFTAFDKNFARDINNILNSSDTKKGADDDMILLIILAIFIPPLAVYLKEDAITKTFWVNLILTLLCGIPGIIHALIVVTK